MSGYGYPRPPVGRRVYAHIQSGSFACPRCGTMHLSETRGRPRTSTSAPTRARTGGYDPRTATFRCRGCAYHAYLGVVFWPRGRGKTGLPGDHVLTPGEAAEMRLNLSYDAGVTPAHPSEERTHMGRIRRTNVECTCGEDCPVHGALGEGGS